jgi:hypothetical protein
VKVGNVSSKHIGRSDRLVWIDEELVKVFLSHDIVEWTEKLENILTEELFEGKE